MKKLILLLLLASSAHAVNFTKTGDIAVGNKNGDRIEVGAVAGTKLKPSIKFAWKLEDNLTMEFVDAGNLNKNQMSIDPTGSTVTFTTGFGTIRVYMTPEGIEYEGVFTRQPPRNYFTFQFYGYENFDFWFQPPLANANPDGSTWEISPRGTLCTRPANVVGSYAVFHKWKINHIIGQTNYGSSKAYHFYRNKLIDALGNVCWCDMSWDPLTGIMIVSADAVWMTNATYPVTLDPNIGNTGTAGSDETDDNNNFCANWCGAAASAADTVKLYVYNSITSGSASHRMAVYTKTGASYGTPDALVTGSDSGNMTISNTTKQWNASANLSATLSSGATYFACFNCNSAAIHMTYDGTGSLQRAHYLGQTYTNFPTATAPAVNPLTGVWYAMYIEYSTTGGGTPAVATVDEIWGNVLKEDGE